VRASETYEQQLRQENARLRSLLRAAAKLIPLRELLDAIARELNDEK
jgi:hypothetical protein